jgi:hypothetical protein
MVPHLRQPSARQVLCIAQVQLFWFYKQPKRAKEHLEKWMRSAMSSRLEPFKKFGSAQEFVEVRN